MYSATQDQSAIFVFGNFELRAVDRAWQPLQLGFFGVDPLSQTSGDDGGQPFGTQQVVEYQEETRSCQALTCDHTSAVSTWALSALPEGQALRAPMPLLKELDESVIEEEKARLAG